MTKNLGYIQRQLSEKFDEVKAHHARIQRKAGRRRIGAYGLKVVAVGCAVAIAAGINPGAAHILGIVTAIAVVTDGIFANHKRLLLDTEAAHAYRRLLRDGENYHQREFATILPLKDTEPPRFEAQLNALNMRVLTALQDGSAQIEDRVAKADLDALQALALDTQQKHSLPPGTP